MASFGEPAPADFFDGCEVVVTQPMVNQRVAPVPLESRAAAAAWGEDGRVTVWCTNQGAQQARGQFGDWLKMDPRSEEHTSELQSRQYLVCRLLLEKKKK